MDILRIGSHAFTPLKCNLNGVVHPKSKIHSFTTDHSVVGGPGDIS